MQNIAIIRQGTGRYLFSLPDNITLKEGDRVKCDTRRGITDGIAFADSAWVDENVSQLIGKLTCAKFPLKSVVGRLEYQPFEKPEDKPIKLYCVKDGMGAFWGKEFSKGDICTFDSAAGAVVLPDGGTLGCSLSPRSYDEWKSENPFRAECLVPLVKRPAKVGEWVYIVKTKAPVLGYKAGDVFKVESVFSGNSADCIESPHWVAPEEYLVLDGYHPEPEAEPEPKYWNGKVVCVESHDECFTVGKMYEFVNGEVKDDEGDKRPMFEDRRFKSVEEWNEAYGSPLVRFVEFKGEAK